MRFTTVHFYGGVKSSLHSDEKNWSVGCEDVGQFPVEINDTIGVGCNYTSFRTYNIT